MKLELVRFGDLYAIPSKNGLSRPSATRGRGYKMINMGELFSNNIINDIEMELVEMSDKEKEIYFVKKNDLLFARQSMVASGAGKCSIINDIPINNITFESHIIRVRLNENIVDPWFYYYYFQLPYNPVKAIINQCAQAGIRGSELKKIRVMYPELSFQKNISNTLKKYDLLIENNNKRIKILEQMIEEIYKEIFSRKDFGILHLSESNCSRNGKYKKIREIISFERGISYSSEEIDCDDGVNLINLKNINSFGGFRRDGYKKYSGKYKDSQIVNKGDLVMGITDMTQDRRTVGHVALVPVSKGVSVISADLVKVNSDINNVYLYCSFKYGDISKYISQYANGSNVLHLRPAMIQNVAIPIVEETVISQFVDLVGPLFEQMEVLNIKNENLTKQRDLLLPRLMSGKLEIKESE